MTQIKIGKRSIGDGQPTYIIAEAGSNHNRSLKTAKKLIDVAKSSGADAVKFQTYSADTLYSKKTPTPKYLRKMTGKSLHQIIKDIELPREFQGELSDYCTQEGIQFLSTPFDYAAVEELAALDMPAYKIASFEIVHLPLLKLVASKKKPILLSTGMASLGDIEDAIEAIGDCPVALLHCVIGYPPPITDINLRVITTLKRAFNVPVGYSDHSMSVSLPAAAVAAGACIIEKHYTLDRKMKGPDHPFALEPNELKAMVKNIREVDDAMGSDKKKLSESEKELYRIGRRSIVAARKIKKGQTINEKDLTIKRPGYGISPKHISLVVGRKAKKDIDEDEIIIWELI